MKTEKCCDLGPAVLRLVLGPLFVVPGVSKLLDPGVIIGMLGNLGFPLPAFFGWLLLLSEIIFGAAVFVGYRVKYTVWPLIVVMVVAVLTVHLPTGATSVMGWVDTLFRLLAAAALVNLYLSGAGKWAFGE